MLRVSCSSDMFAFDIDVVVSRRFDCQRCKMSLEMAAMAMFYISTSLLNTEYTTNSLPDDTLISGGKKYQNKLNDNGYLAFVPIRLYATPAIESIVLFHFIIEFIIIIGYHVLEPRATRNDRKESKEKQPFFFGIFCSLSFLGRSICVRVL